MISQQASYPVCDLPGQWSLAESFRVSLLILSINQISRCNRNDQESFFRYDAVTELSRLADAQYSRNILPGQKPENSLCGSLFPLIFINYL